MGDRANLFSNGQIAVTDKYRLGYEASDWASKDSCQWVTCPKFDRCRKKYSRNHVKCIHKP